MVKSHMKTDLIPAINAALSGQCFVSSFGAVQLGISLVVARLMPQYKGTGQVFRC